MDQPLVTTTPEVAGDLMIGAEVIAEFLYGDRGRVRDVYRNPACFSFFKHGNSIAALKSTICAEIKEAERSAREARQRLIEHRVPPMATPTRRRRSKRRGSRIGPANATC